MNNIYEYLSKLAVAKGKEKKNLLIEFLKDDYFVEILKLTLDKRITFNIKELPDPVSNFLEGPTEGYTLETAIQGLYGLSNRMVTGNEALDWVSNVLFQLDEESRSVFTKVITKDLRCGVGAKTVNKAAGYELIYNHPYMNYSSFSDKNLDKIKYPAYIQPKLDGLYVDIIIEGQDVKFITRNGIELPMTNAIKDNIRDNIMLDNVVLQGEGLVYNDNKDEYLPRKEGNGIFNSDEIQDYEDKIVFIIWDIILLEHFLKRNCDITYDERIRHANELITFNGNLKYLIFNNTELVMNKEHAYTVYEQHLSEGYEGSVLKDLNLTWRYGAAKGGVKMKPIREADLIVVGINPGAEKGKFRNAIGSLMCRTSDGLVEVGVAGLSDSQRGVSSLKNSDGMIIGYMPIEGFDANQYIGKIISVQYNEIITNESNPDIYSLFLPRTKKNEEGEIEFRYDKDEPDSYDDLLEKEKGG